MSHDLWVQAAVGNYQEAEEILLTITSEKLKQEGIPICQLERRNFFNNIQKPTTSSQKPTKGPH
jgi:hypothetical protein